MSQQPWDVVRHRYGLTGSPRLEDVLAGMECTVEHSLPGGDHEIIVGRVQDVEPAGDGAQPLLHWRGDYATLGRTGPRPATLRAMA